MVEENVIEITEILQTQMQESHPFTDPHQGHTVEMKERETNKSISKEEIIKDNDTSNEKEGGEGGTQHLNLQTPWRE